MRGVPSVSDIQPWLGHVIADHLIHSEPEPESRDDNEWYEPEYGQEVELTEIFRER